MPPIFSVLICIWWIWWITVIIYMYSIGDLNKNPENPFDTVKWNPYTRFYLWFHAIIGLWINSFILILN